MSGTAIDGILSRAREAHITYLNRYPKDIRYLVALLQRAEAIMTVVAESNPREYEMSECIMCQAGYGVKHFDDCPTVMAQQWLDDIKGDEA